MEILQEIWSEYLLVGTFRVKYITQMTYEFFKDFDQNSGWKCSWLQNSREFLGIPLEYLIRIPADN